MSAELQKAEQIFTRAIELDDLEERQAFVRGACGGEPRLLECVNRLLQAHEHAEEAFPSEPGDHLAETSISEGPGTIIGRYKLLQRLGEGGCGIVYMAEQEEPVRRRVALKVIKLGMDTRQALALMDHPNIAKVLDAGATEAGRPYFVMELVRGVAPRDSPPFTGLGGWRIPGNVGRNNGADLLTPSINRLRRLDHCDRRHAVLQPAGHHRAGDRSLECLPGCDSTCPLRTRISNLCPAKRACRAKPGKQNQNRPR